MNKSYKFNGKIYTEEDLIKQAGEANMTVNQYKGFLFSAGMEEVDPSDQVDLTKLPNLAAGESFDAFGNVVDINKQIVRAPEGKTVEEAKIEVKKSKAIDASQNLIAPDKSEGDEKYYSDLGDLKI